MKNREFSENGIEIGQTIRLKLTGDDMFYIMALQYICKSEDGKFPDLKELFMKLVRKELRKESNAANGFTEKIAKLLKEEDI